MTLSLVMRVAAALTILGSAGLATAQSTKPVPDCRISHLTAAPDPAEMAASGHRAMTIAVRNKSKAPCKVEGVPDVAFLDKENSSLPVHVCSNCPADMFPVQPVQTVVLKQHEAAYLVIAFTDIDGNEGCKQAATFTLQIGKERRPIRIRLDGMRTCGVVDITPFLSKPLQPGIQSASAARP
jgi:hypothetical protein